MMVEEDREPLVTLSVRLAKAKVAGSNPVFRSNSCLGFALEFGEGRGSSFQYLDPSWTWRATNSNSMSFGGPRQLREKTRSADSTIGERRLGKATVMGPNWNSRPRR